MPQACGSRRKAPKGQARHERAPHDHGGMSAAHRAHDRVLDHRPVRDLAGPDLPAVFADALRYRGRPGRARRPRLQPDPALPAGRAVALAGHGALIVLALLILVFLLAVGTSYLYAWYLAGEPLTARDHAKSRAVVSIAPPPRSRSRQPGAAAVPRRPVTPIYFGRGRRASCARRARRGRVVPFGFSVSSPVTLFSTSCAVPLIACPAASTSSPMPRAVLHALSDGRANRPSNRSAA